MNYTYELYVYDLLFRINSPVELTLPGYFQPFLLPEVSRQNAEIDISVHPSGFVTAPDEKSSYIQRYEWKNAEFITRAESISHPGKIDLYIPPGFLHQFAENSNWLLYLALERQIIHFKRFFLHASAVIYKQKAILFSSPSGGGKSTQAALWEKYRNAEILNGDKVVLGLKEDCLTAYGGPVSGSSPIYVNESAPVSVILFLEKGTTNSIRPYSTKEKFLALYSEAVKSISDENFNSRLLEIIWRICPKAEMFHFTCTPDQAAVEFISEQLERF